MLSLDRHAPNVGEPLQARAVVCQGVKGVGVPGDVLEMVSQRPLAGDIDLLLDVFFKPLIAKFERIRLGLLLWFGLLKVPNREVFTSKQL